MGAYEKGGRSCRRQCHHLEILSVKELRMKTALSQLHVIMIHAKDMMILNQASLQSAGRAS